MAVKDTPAPIRIEKLVAGGRGLARVEGRVWLVQGAVPGDLVLAEPIRAKPGLVEARIAGILEPSPTRRRPPCPIQDRCGGCPWMILGEAEQRDWKGKILEESLARLGGFRELAFEGVLPSPLDLGYRNKVELTFGREGGRTVLGYHEAGSPGRLLDVDRCLLQGEAAHRVLGVARAFFLDGPGRGDPGLGDARGPLRLVIRRSFADGSVVIALHGPPGPLPTAPDFARQVAAEVPEVAGVVRLLAVPGRRSGTRSQLLVGRPWLEESLGGHVFRIPAETFFQVNPLAAEQLVGLVREVAGAGAGARVLDLYGGVGVHALALADLGAEVTVCEADHGAVTCGRHAASAAKLPVRFVGAEVGSFLRTPAAAAVGAEIVVANPPRDGFGPGVAEGIARLSPARIIVVSCDPPTLARDLRALARRGYRARRVVGVDLFPQTPHVEAVALLERSLAGR